MAYPPSRRCQEVEVRATDTSFAACLVARANVRRHGLESRVLVRDGDLLEPVPGRFDLIVANLPYVAAEAAGNHPELLAEPADAVFAPGDGLGPSRRLVAAAAGRLTGDGLLLLQLHRRVVAARRPDLPALAAALDLGGSAFTYGLEPRTFAAPA